MGKLDETLARYRQILSYNPATGHLIKEADEVAPTPLPGLTPTGDGTAPAPQDNSTEFEPMNQQAPQENLPAPAQEEPAPETAPQEEGGTETIDVTDIIDGMSELNKKTDSLMSAMETLAQTAQAMDMLVQRMEKLNQDIEEIKPPTVDQKLDMISLNSAPYNTRLDKYWDEKNTELRDQHGYEFQPAAEKTSDEPEEYIIDPEQVKDFNDDEIKNSF